MGQTTVRHLHGEDASRSSPLEYWLAQERMVNTIHDRLSDPVAEQEPGNMPGGWWLLP